MRDTRDVSPAPEDDPGDGEPDLFGSLAHLSGSSRSASAKTVWIALGANFLVGVAKSVAAVVTGSASMLAEAAHSWADTGNEVFLLVANRRSNRPPDRAHPLGHGREAYVWSLLAALGLFVAGAAVSVTHGIQELITPEPATNFAVGYVVLALSFVLEAFSFLRSVSQARPTAELFGRDLIEEVMATSDPTLRAVFFEDAAALVGLVIATGGLAVHQATGSPTPDAVGSILVGLLLAVVAVVLIDRNRQFLVGEEVDPRVRAAAIEALLSVPEVARVTYLRLAVVGPRMVYIIGDVDLVGDETETHVALRLRALEARISASPAVAGAVLSLSAPDEPSLSPGSVDA
ncbi:MAG TPA: cation diffusion facilitator family transporter [Beijerinckiaceae bacterium]|jgi:cation diffusion facilitator family transporter|nr:cation diffusion facilitator family transporter [Beijerinckiaceae bacterium]